MQNQQRIIPIEGVINFRDIGGYVNRNARVVKWGKVFRSGQMYRLSDLGIKQMSALGIKKVIDLRFNEEVERFPTTRTAMPDADFKSWGDLHAPHYQQQTSEKMAGSWHDALETGDPHQVHEAMRLNYPQKLYSHAAIYEHMIRAIINDDTPLVFHCAAGKDRTGVAAALILSLIDVDRATIRDDYLLTQSQMGALKDHWLAGGAAGHKDYKDMQSRLTQYPLDVVNPVFDAAPEYIDTLLNYVDSQYGDFIGYAKSQLNLSDTDIDALKSALLQP